MTTQVSEEYVMGINEGESILRSWIADYGQPSIEEMQAFRDNAIARLKERPSRNIAEMARGERDFWKGQLKKVKQ